ncbi:MAG: hypothetical protein ABIZ92_07610 [Vicinamibacterales bacterium]
MAAVFFFLLATLPPAPIRIALDTVDPALVARTVSGAYHIHTSISDGAERKASIAAAAARAGLRFAIFTDHGDGTRPPDPPAYLSGVLCIDGVEISTTHGHLVVLDLAVAPYPLGGAPSAVAEDVRRLGGFAIAAHPDHPKSEMAWRDWHVPVDGIEWINADVEWRNESALRLPRVLFDYLFRPPAALASVFDRPRQTIERWDAMDSARPVVGLGAADAHGGGRRSTAEGRAPGLGVGPGYQASFGSLSNRVLLEKPLSGDPLADADLLMEAIRAGRVYSVIDPVSPDVLLALDQGNQFVVASPLPTGAQPLEVADRGRRGLEIAAPRAPGNPPVPWVVANWVGRRAALAAPVAPPSAGPGTPVTVASLWRVEKDPMSSGHVSESGGVVALNFRLQAGQRASQFVAAAVDLGQGQTFTRIAFHGQAQRPMRVSFQLRVLPDDARWISSVYLEPFAREVVIDVKDLRPADSDVSGIPDFSRVRSILFVVDLVNARPGAAGALTIGGLRGFR